MSYFSNFPKMLYSTSLGVANPKAVTNIIAKVNFLSESINNTSIFYNYSVKDGERPEDIAYKMYKDPKKHWIILLSNNILDPQYDWVLSTNQLEDYINKKYSSITFNLDPSESYTSSYTVGETVYQGSSLDKADCVGTVVAYSSGNKTLQIKFADQVFANNANVTGATSNVTHKVVGMTYNNDGYNWASNTTYYSLLTEVASNNYDGKKTTTKYQVTAKDYNWETDSVIDKNVNISYSNTYNLVDGSTLTVDTTIAPVTYYDYELNLNEEKRSIIIIKPTFVPSIENELRRLMRS
jgi:hypothetical protein